MGTAAESNTTSRIESEIEVRMFLKDLRFALQNGAKIDFQEVRRVDENRDPKFTNRYTVAALFPDEKPTDALRRELQTLTVEEYLRTVKDTRFPKKKEMREFGKVYNGTQDVYIKLRVELLNPNGVGNHTTFVMSFHFAEKPLADEVFPYKKKA